MEVQEDVLSMLREPEKGWGQVREHAKPFHQHRAEERYSEPNIVGFVANFPCRVISMTKASRIIEYVAPILKNMFDL